MQDLIEPIIHKAALSNLRIALKNTGLSIGDTANLCLGDDGEITVYATISKRSFLLRRRVNAAIGQLGPRAGLLLTAALRRGDHLRVRIVGMTPEHLSADGNAEMFISVWGNVQHAKPAPGPKATV